MVCFPNTYVHTLNKKKNFFFTSPLSKKNKGGGAGDLVGGKTHFFGQTEISGRWVARGSKNRPGGNFGHVAHSTSRNFNFNEKQKRNAS